jgi:phospholipid/cholesterol/gamma-HCH transport system substrate-binding protein
MVLTKLIKRQLRIFAVLTAVALGLMVFTYARIPAMVGIGVYSVKTEFTDASGLYPKALVTYRGVKVGQVSDLELGPTTAVATLRLDNGTKIPGNVDAELHSTSAVGEQYIDLVPKGESTTALKDGDLIDQTRTVEMPQITPVLDSVNNLLKSVPLKETTHVLDQINEGLGSDGPQLGEFIDASGKLVNEAQRQIAATTGLIRALEPVLATQQQVAPRTIGYASSLRVLTRQLAAKDADLRTLLRAGGPGLDKVSATVNDLQASLPMLLDNLSVSGKVLHTYLPQLEQALVVYPATVGRLQQAVNPRAKQGDVQLDLRAGLNNPPSCSQGYLSTDDRRSPADRTVRKVDTLAHCEKAPTNPSSIRGARNLPCPNSSARGPLPSSCGLTFGSGQWPEGYDANAPARTADDPETRTTTSDDAWQQLFLQPVGLW